MPAVAVIPTVTKLAVAEKHMGTPACRSLSEQSPGDRKAASIGPKREQPADA